MNPTLPLTRPELRAFLAATAVVVLHIVDDNFLQPAAGTTAGDHLVSGLVPLAVVGLGAWTFPRVRAGARALIAFLVGFLSLVTGAVEAGYYASVIGPSGDDWSGLLAGAAGLGLVCPSAPASSGVLAVLVPAAHGGTSAAC